MSFENLNKDELTKVAKFFNKEIVVADEEKGPSKKELIAALVADGATGPVSWDDYKNVYLGPETDNDGEDKPDEPEADEPVEDSPEPEEEKSAPVEGGEPSGNMVLIKMERKNATFDIRGMRFSKEHPYRSVEAEVAEEIIENVPGFRMALPSEVRDYYN